MNPTERFWAKVDRSGECWVWTASTQRNGYGYFSVAGRVVKAHRFAWTMVNGPIPDGLWVLHHCDNPPCVRVDHLFLGTNQDNVDDREAKGRTVRGHRLGTSKLTEADVVAIREQYALGVSQRRLGAMFGIHQTTVGALTSGETWRHVR